MAPIARAACIHQLASHWHLCSQANSWGPEVANREVPEPRAEGTRTSWQQQGPHLGRGQETRDCTHKLQELAPQCASPTHIQRQPAQRPGLPSHSAESFLPNRTTEENFELLASCKSWYALRLVVGQHCAASDIHIPRLGGPDLFSGYGSSIYSGQHDASLTGGSGLPWVESTPFIVLGLWVGTIPFV